MALNLRPDDHESPPFRTDHVGAALRARRMAHDLSVGDIASALRIRAPFLDAIEQARYDLLPGIPYAIGFVRSYAEYIGLNGNEMVARFKVEAAGIEQRTALTFPSPAPRGKVPGGGPLLVALLVAIGIAAGWYFWRDEVQDLAVRVAEVPQELLASARIGPNDLPRSLPPSPAAPAPAAPSSPGPSSLGPSSSAPSQSEAASVPPPVTAGPVPPQPALPPVAVPPRQPAQPPVASLDQPEDSPPPPPTSIGPNPPPLPPETDDTAAILPPPPPPPPPAEGRVFGGQNADSRIVIRAKGESWVQIRDSDNQAILTRVLRAGDSYRVPNKSGLTMWTGNAGVLELVIDGQTAPSLGAVGLVRRNVPLDVERLKAGVPE